MPKISKIYWIALIILWLAAMWYWADDDDYFRDDYRYMTKEQKAFFKWYDNESEQDFKRKYEQFFNDTAFYFPRQAVTKIKIFQNKPMLGVFTAKSLLPEKINEFLQLCNDSANFSWGETTWNTSDAQYYVRFYNSNNKVCGKIYFDLENGITQCTPFCPVNKFGGLSPKGTKNFNQFINAELNWEK